MPAAATARGLDARAAGGAGDRTPSSRAARRRTRAGPDPQAISGRRPGTAVRGRSAPAQRPGREPAPRGVKGGLRFLAASLLDRLLRGPTWIALLGMLLAGIVFFNVGVLELNREITRTADRATSLRRENEALRQRLAHLGSSERIQQVAAAHGLALPAPGSVRYLRADPGVDAERAAQWVAEPTASTGATAAISGAPATAGSAGETDAATGTGTPSATSASSGIEAASTRHGG